MASFHFTFLSTWTIFFKLMAALILIRVHGSMHRSHGSAQFLSNGTITGEKQGCKHTSPYFVNPNVQFRMCVGIQDYDLKNGMTIINLIRARGFLPTCRVMQLMLWMASEVTDPISFPKHIQKDLFVDIGANIGSCSVHMAALGFPVVSVEPVRDHIDIIQGSHAINPSFHMEILHGGISNVEKQFRVKYFNHGARNWGATALVEAEGNETAVAELPMWTTDQIIGHRKIALMKIDCEGCELDALLSARKTLRRVPMVKIELVQEEYISGNVTMGPNAIIEHLVNNNFDVYIDHWNENPLYFGHHGNTLMEIDQMFGSAKFELNTNTSLLFDSARRILSNSVNQYTFKRIQFLRKATDIIGIEKTLSAKMKIFFGVS